MQFNIILEKDEDGFSVIVPALDGCYTQGDTEEEAILNAREAIICYLQGTLNNILKKVNLTINELKDLI